MMELEAERMVNLIINDDPKGPFISERDVVKEERRQRIDNNPGVILQEQVLSQIWKGDTPTRSRLSARWMRSRP
jgi:zinc protease